MRALLLIAALACGTALSCGPVRAEGLKDAFAGDFLIGAALNQRQFDQRDPKVADLIPQQFNSVTAENVLKFARVHPNPGRFQFEEADNFVRYGEDHHMIVIGHNLVWHNQTPDWVFRDEEGNPLGREALLARMHEHIAAVVGRYKGRIHGWDVVNEALNDDGTLRQSPWFKIIGPDYIERAFRFAHEADPAAELYYNDFSLERPDKRAGALKLIQALKQAGVPIAAIGLQDHDRMNWPSLADEEATIRAFAALGIKINITELDIDMLPPAVKDPTAEVSLKTKDYDQRLDPYRDGLPAEMQEAEARRYAELFALFRRYRGTITRVTFWNVSDGDSWLNDWPVRGRHNYPLLFDRDGRPKPAYDAVMRVAKEQP
jgi:endo-1,4-beta-xylanase